MSDRRPSALPTRRPRNKPRRVGSIEPAATCRPMSPLGSPGEWHPGRFPTDDALRSSIARSCTTCLTNWAALPTGSPPESWFNNLSGPRKTSTSSTKMNEPRESGSTTKQTKRPFVQLGRGQPADGVAFRPRTVDFMVQGHEVAYVTVVAAVVANEHGDGGRPGRRRPRRPPCGRKRPRSAAPRPDPRSP